MAWRGGGVAETWGGLDITIDDVEFCCWLMDSDIYAHYLPNIKNSIPHALLLVKQRRRICYFYSMNSFLLHMRRNPLKPL